MEGEIQNQINKVEAKEDGFCIKLFNIFVNPIKAFIAIDRRPTWLIPMIIVAVLSVCFTYITYPIIMQSQMEMLRSNPNISAEQLKAIEQQLSEAGAMQKYIATATPILIIPITYFIIAGIFYFVGSVIMGGDSSYIKLLSVFSWSSLISIASIIIKLPLVFVKQSIYVTISPALLLPGDAVDSVLYKILSQFDFFTIWQLAVFAIGFGYIYKFSTNKSFTAVGALWVIWIIISVVASSLFKGFGMA